MPWGFSLEPFSAQAPRGLEPTINFRNTLYETAATMNVLVDKMVQEGLIDEAVARGLSGLLASGDRPARAFAACGLAEEPLLRFWTRQFGYPYVQLE